MKKNSLLLVLLLLQVLVYGRKANSSSLQRQPLSFQENKGQIRDQQGNTRSDIDFILQTPDMTLYIGKGQLHYQFIRQQAGAEVVASRLDVSLKGANKQAVLLKEAPQQTKYHYYTGKSTEGITGVKTYRKIIYKDIYPSIDWVLYTNGSSLKYDFIVHPGGNVSDVQMKYEGAKTMVQQPDGSLEITTSLGNLKEDAPYSYEKQSKKAVASTFMLHDNTVSFKTDAYDGALVIDPGVEWATYFGGTADEGTQGMALDPEGSIYISGTTQSLSNIATTGSYQDTFGGGLNDAFLAKFDSTGQLQWATYYGGSGTTSIVSGLESGGAVSCDAFGHVYLTGATLSSNGIATPGSYQDTINPVPVGFNGLNGYLAQFDKNSGLRQWGTYYGGSTENTTFVTVGCDQEGNVYVGGFADSSTSVSGALVTTGAHQVTYGGGLFDGVLVKFDSSGNRQWATYYGGEGHDRVLALACDDSNNIFISGMASSSTTGIATPGTLEDVFGPETGNYLSKFNSAGVRQWGTYLRGTGDALALDAYQHLYVSGRTDVGPDTFIATPGCYQPFTINTYYNAYLMQFNPATGTRNWGTYYGSEGNTYGKNVACDLFGNVYLSGYTDCFGTNTWSIATPGSYQDTLNAPPGTVGPEYDAFVAQFDSTGSRKWATYYGGAALDMPYAVACDLSGALYLSGMTASAGSIATTGTYQTTFGGATDAFLVRFLPVDIALQAVVNPEHDTVCAGDVPFSVRVKNQGRMDKEDTLKISYNFSGPSTGSLDTFFTGGLTAGAEDIFDLGSLDLAFPGDYDVTVYLHYTRDDNERDNDTIHLTLTATNAAPVADIEVSQVGSAFHFSNANAQPSDSYSWDFGDGETSTDANPTHEYEVTDSYLVTLIVTGFCGSDTATVMVAGIGDPEGISDPALAGKLSIYPNPAAQILYLKAEAGLQLENYSITNALGQQVQNGALKNQRSVNLSSLASGTYFIRITTDKGTFSKQFQVLQR